MLDTQEKIVAYVGLGETAGVWGKGGRQCCYWLVQCLEYCEQF